MKLAEGEKELINATEDLAKMLAEADPTIVDSDVFKITAENETDKDKLLEDWKVVKRVNQDTFKLAKDMVDQSKIKEVIAIPNASTSSVQRKFVPDQTLKPKLLSDSADLLEVKGFIKEFKNYIQSGYGIGEEVSAGHYIQMRNILVLKLEFHLDSTKNTSADLTFVS